MTVEHPFLDPDAGRTGAAVSNLLRVLAHMPQSVLEKGAVAHLGYYRDTAKAARIGRALGTPDLAAENAEPWFRALVGMFGAERHRRELELLFLRMELDNDEPGELVPPAE